LRHFDQELDDLKAKILEMSALVETAIYRSIQSVVERNPELAYQVIANEERIDDLEIEIDEEAVRLIALQQPVAADLRLITATAKINNDLERMGDLAVSIAKRTLKLVHLPRVDVAIDIPHMAELVQAMVRKTLDSFVHRDADLARLVLAADDEVDAIKTASYGELVAYMGKNPDSIPVGLQLLGVVRNLERIADHATNIAEGVLFLITGIDVRHHAEERRLASRSSSQKAQDQ
jgi:phosphate transport system protein